MTSDAENDPLIVDREQRARDGVRKYLFRLHDGELIETVAIPSPRRTTLCVSSQVGCAVGCTFCATARMGFRRDLRANEIVAQYRRVRDLVAADPEGIPFPIENIVFMGMGEPFLNFDEVSAALRELIDHEGFHSRIVTVSTIGIPNRILPFGRAFPHVRLAISLHGPTDELRSRLVPINRRHPIAEILAACREYNRVIGRKIFFEYVLMAGVNDRPEDAERLAILLDGLDATVNLIPLNSGGRGDESRPSRERTDAFRSRLKEGFPGHVTFRQSRGLDIAAACGQLAASG